MASNKGRQAQTEEQGMVLFELYAGNAPSFRCDRAGNVVDLTEGQTVESDLPLDKMWPAKFVRVDRIEEMPAAAMKRRKRRLGRTQFATQQQAGRPQPQGQQEEKPAAEKTDVEHEDVTDQFPSAADNDFKVTYVHRKGYTIHENDSPVNDEPFRSSKEVSTKLEELTGGHEPPHGGAAKPRRGGRHK